LTQIITNWFLRRKIDAHVRQPGRAMEHRRVVNPYHAVSVEAGPKCCNEARELKGRRFLSAAAPKIPLANCDAKSCGCRFIHFEDRREGEDRRERTVDARGQSMPDRRHGRGLRESD